MYGKGTLAKTGATVSLFGTTVAFEWTVALIVGLVAVGAVLYRVGKRKERYR
jgi:hypothetical protein